MEKIPKKYDNIEENFQLRRSSCLEIGEIAKKTFIKAFARHWEPPLALVSTILEKFKTNTPSRFPTLAAAKIASKTTFNAIRSQRIIPDVSPQDPSQNSRKPPFFKLRSDGDPVEEMRKKIDEQKRRRRGSRREKETGIKNGGLTSKSQNEFFEILIEDKELYAHVQKIRTTRDH